MLFDSLDAHFFLWLFAIVHIFVFRIRLSRTRTHTQTPIYRYIRTTIIRKETTNGREIVFLCCTKQRCVQYIWCYRIVCQFAWIVLQLQFISMWLPIVYEKKKLTIKAIALKCRGTAHTYTQKRLSRTYYQILASDTMMRQSQKNCEFAVWDGKIPNEWASNKSEAEKNSKNLSRMKYKRDGTRRNGQKTKEWNTERSGAEPQKPIKNNAQLMEARKTNRAHRQHTDTGGALTPKLHFYHFIHISDGLSVCVCALSSIFGLSGDY